MFYCPFCDDFMVATEKPAPVCEPLLRRLRAAWSVRCRGCGTISEVDVRNGALVDLPGYQLANLYAPHNGLGLTRTPRTPRPGRLHEGRES